MTSIRPLTAMDAPAYKALRREILVSRDAQYFSDSFERERVLSDKQWLDWCSEKHEHAILGAFDGTALVGIIMVTSQGENNYPLAEMEAAWVHPHYRGRLGYKLYKAGLDWAKVSGYSYVISFIRDSAKASTRLCKALGYVYAYTVKDELWADGSVANTDAYVISLAGADPNERRKLSGMNKAYIINLASQTLHAPATVPHTLVALQSIQNEIIGLDEGRDQTVNINQFISKVISGGVFERRSLIEG